MRPLDLYSSQRTRFCIFGLCAVQWWFHVVCDTHEATTDEVKSSWNLEPVPLVLVKPWELFVCFVYFIQIQANPIVKGHDRFMAVKTVLYYIGTSRIFIKDVLSVAFVGIKFEIHQILAFGKKFKKSINSWC